MEEVLSGAGSMTILDSELQGLLPMLQIDSEIGSGAGQQERQE